MKKLVGTADAFRRRMVRQVCQYFCGQVDRLGGDASGGQWTDWVAILLEASEYIITHFSLMC